jgi:hypothetical protein
VQRSEAVPDRVRARSSPHSVAGDFRSRSIFAVREAFLSKSSLAELVYGTVTPETPPLRLRSRMPDNGVVFSDGMESDFLRFTAGLEATISIAAERGQLVVLARSGLRACTPRGLLLGCG